MQQGGGSGKVDARGARRPPRTDGVAAVPVAQRHPGAGERAGGEVRAVEARFTAGTSQAGGVSAAWAGRLWGACYRAHALRQPTTRCTRRCRLSASCTAVVWGSPRRSGCTGGRQRGRRQVERRRKARRRCAGMGRTAGGLSCHLVSRPATSHCTEALTKSQPSMSLHLKGGRGEMGDAGRSGIPMNAVHTLPPTSPAPPHAAARCLQALPHSHAAWGLRAGALARGQAR